MSLLHGQSHDGGLGGARRMARVWTLFLMAGALAWWLQAPPAPPPAELPPPYDPYDRFRCDVNAADEAALQKLPGIGPALARRIVEQRERVGGFLTLDEVRQLPGLKRQWERCGPYLLLDARRADSLRGASRQQKAQGPRTDLNRADSAAIVERAGLPGWLARRLARYRDASGGFRDWAHVARTWNLSEAQLRDLQAAFTLAPPPCIDLNRADFAALDRLPLIGEKRANAILKYRALLGFFARIEQLREVYNLPDSVFERVRPLVCVRKLPPPPIEINTAPADSLALHPYLRPKSRARRIVRYRQEAGLFRSVEDLVAAGLIEGEEAERLRPYLSFKRP